MAERVYSYEVFDRVQEKLPKEITEALRLNGWNALGIYELVARELRHEAKRRKLTPNAALTGAPETKEKSHERREVR
jgi:hypothetical protein